MLIAETIEAQEGNTPMNIYTVVEMTDLDGKKFQTRQLVGSYTKQGLEQEKVMLQQQIEAINNQIASVDEKIALFN